MKPGKGILVSIGETEWHDLKRLHSFPRSEECAHKRLQYVEHGELLLCLDCDKQVGAIWALRMYFTQVEREKEKLAAERTELEADTKKAVIHRAALAVQDAWRRRKYLPTCPHCRKPIEPSDRFGRSGTTQKELALPLVMSANLEVVDRAQMEGL